MFTGGYGNRRSVLGAYPAGSAGPRGAPRGGPHGGYLNRPHFPQSVPVAAASVFPTPVSAFSAPSQVSTMLFNLLDHILHSEKLKGDGLNHHFLDSSIL